MNELQGITALVTGAGKGIGAGIATSLAAAGATVAVNYANDRPTAERVADEDAVTGMFERVRERLGPVQLLVNNAGIWTFEPLADVTVAQYRRHFDTNVLGNVLASRAFAGQPDVDGGGIINITSVGIGPAGPGTSLYTATKMAIVGLTKVLAVELAPRGIRVNAIAAGLIDTDGTRASGFIGSDAATATLASIPLGRIGTPDDIGDVAAFLASPAARYVTGETLFAAGGLQLT